MNLTKALIPLSILLMTIPASAQFKKAELQAAGVTCSMCCNTINKSLQSLSFVEKVTTDLNKGVFRICFKESAHIDLDALRIKVENAGFSVANLWVYLDFSNEEIKEERRVDLGGIQLRFIHVKDQLLNGEQKIKIIDKHFVRVSEFKKYNLKGQRMVTTPERLFNVTI